MRRNYGLSPPLVAGAVDIAGLAMPAPVVPVAPPFMPPLPIEPPGLPCVMLRIELRCIVM